MCVLWGAIGWNVWTASIGFAQDARDDQHSLSHLFGNSLTPDPLEVYRLSRQMPVARRYKYLLEKVLPADSNEIRLTIDYLPTNPSPPVIKNYGAGDSPLEFPAGQARRPAGGVLISPAIELVEAAQQLGKLDELRANVSRRSSADVEQVKARLVMEILIAWAGNVEPAEETLTELISLVRTTAVTDSERAPESVILASGFQSPDRLDQCYDLIYLLYSQTHTEKSLHSDRFQRHISSLYFLVDLQQQPDAPRGPAAYSLAHWNKVSRCTAETRGKGFPNAVWTAREHSASKVTSHDDDYLYYAIPLQGEYEIEADLTTFDYREIRLSVGDRWLGPRYTLFDCQRGSFRTELPSVPLKSPLAHMHEQMRARAVVRGDACEFSINGRRVWTQQLHPPGDPWVALQCSWFTHGAVENLRISGHPEIPEELDLLSSNELPGWLPYFEESAGEPESDWRMVRSNLNDAPELTGRSRPGLRGARQESLLRYHRPMLEDGTIEYEFFYKEGESAVYPTLDRCCFLFDRDGTGIHWLTDGRYDPTGIDPANLTASKSVSTIPLIEGAWNRTRLSLSGDTVTLALNDVTRLTCQLEPENQRTFGLFHYADQTEARVRKLRWRGAWPKQLPDLREQELADYSVEDKIADGPELPVVFEHDFSEGLPPDKIWGGGSEGWHFHMKQLPSGVRIGRGSGWYAHHTLSFPLRLEGDFDVTLAYEDFQSQVSEEGTGDIQLAVNFDDKTATDFRVYRKHHQRKSGQHDQLIEMARFEQRENNTQQNWYGQTAEEGTAGRIRVVRRSDQLFLLHGSHDSQHERLIDQQQVTTEPLRFGGLKAIVETHRDGETSVIWKRITVRSEHPERIADYSGMTIEKLDMQREKLRDVERIKFNEETSPDLIQTWGTIDELQKQEDGWLVRKAGTDRWSAGAFVPQVGMAGDYDVTLDLEILKLEAAAANQDTYLLLQNRVNSRFSRNVEIKLVSTMRGKRELSLQQNTTHRNGSTRLEKLKIVPLQNVTRFRLARRGEVLYFVYRPEADAAEQICGYLIVGTDDISPGFLRTMFRTGGAGKETVVKFKSMSLHAERLIKPDPS